METVKKLFYLITFLGCFSSFGQEITPATQNDGVLIQQVGNGNIVSSKVASKATRLKINQEGDLNYLNSSYNTKSLDHSIQQNGNNNKVFDFQFDPNQENSLNLIQNANNAHFERFGTNSIGNKMKVHMGGNTKTIIVRNFK